jgi:5'(3')-deoxyribonucleotidase
MINPEQFGNSHKDPVWGYLENPKPLVFIDMDGVLADAEAKMKIWSSKLGLSTEELFKKKLYHMPGFYLDLPLIEGAKSAFELLSKHFEVYILTAPSWENPSCYTDKRLWVEKYLGDAAYKRLIISNDKSLFHGRALIDDRTKYGVTKFQGEHIHFGTEKFPDWNSVTSYLLEYPQK